MKDSTIAAFLTENWEQLLQDAQTLMRIPSVSGEAEPPYPFGRECARVLDKALEIGRAMGFETENHEYYAGSILYPGTETGEIGIFAHLDVVHEGTGWLRPPYDPYVKDGWLYGRGSADDKAPAVVALYAMLCLKKQGVQPRRTIRLFLGCSEECGMKDIRYYTEHYPLPDFSFTPDASFSVCYSEKGILETTYSAALPKGVLEWTAGAASNAVAGQARARIVTRKPLIVEPERWPTITVTEDDGIWTVEAVGRSAHAAFPEGSVNATALLASYLCQSGALTVSAQHTLSFLARYFQDSYGEALGIAHSSPELGKLTCVAGMIRSNGSQLTQSVNIRYPAEADSAVIIRRLNGTAAQYGWQPTSCDNDPPSYISPDEPIIQALGLICQERLGSSFVPYTMGGGTYARHLPNAVAYGPGIRGMAKPGPAGHGGGHQPDECISLRVLRDALPIYVKALEEIDRLLP